MSDPQSTPTNLPDMRSVVAKHWTLFLIEGILLVLLGIGAIIVPPIAGLAVTIFLGWLFLIGGIAGLALTFWARELPGFWWSLLSALLSLAAGVILIGWPAHGLFSLTIVLTAFFIMEGATSIMFALDHKRELSGRWGWMLAAGIVDLVIAVLIFAGLPGSAAWRSASWSASISCSAAHR